MTANTAICKITIFGHGFGANQVHTEHAAYAEGYEGFPRIACITSSAGCTDCSATDDSVYLDFPDNNIIHFWTVSSVIGNSGTSCQFKSDSIQLDLNLFKNITPQDHDPGTIVCPDQISYPINAANGNMNLTRSDVSISTDYGPSIFFERSYNSGGDTSTSVPLGPKWTHVFQQSLVIDTSGDIKYFDGSGRKIFFNKKLAIFNDGSGPDTTISYVTPMAFNFQLSHDDSNNEFIMKRLGDTKLTFDSTGILKSIADIKNKKIRIVNDGNLLDSVIDASGRFLTFHYDANDKLEYIRQKGDTTLVTFDYDNNSGDTLKRVTYYDGTWESYEYTDEGNAKWLLTKVTNSDSVQYFFEYDSLSRGTSTYMLDSVNKVDVFYSTSDTSGVFAYLTKTVFGNDTTIYESVWLPDQSIRSRNRTTNSGCLSCGTAYEYDQFGQLKLTTYANGRIDSMQYSDTSKQITSYTKAYGDSLQHITNFEYGTDLFLLTKTWDSSLFSGVRSTDYFYNSTNAKLDSIKSIVKQGGGTTQTLITRFLYNDSLQVKNIDGPRAVADTLGFIYYSNRDLKIIRRPNGDSTQFGQRNNLGQRTTITDGNNITTAFVYDKRGRLTNLIHGLGDVDSLLTTYTYTFSSKIKSVTFPRGNSLNYTYDKHDWLVAIENNAGDSIAYGYDSLSNRISEKIYSSDDTLRKSENYLFNEKSQLLKIISAASDSTFFFYDDMGNLEKLMDANHDTTRYVYDQLNRLDSLIQFLDGAKITTQFDYDKHDNLIKVIDPEAEQYAYKYDDRGLLLYDSSGVTGPASYKYDSSGNLIERLNSMVDTTYFYYDDLNRLTHIHYDDFDDHVYYYYDGAGFNRKGRLYKEQSSTCSTVFKYDWPGQVSEERLTYHSDSKFYDTKYDYDKNGNITLITYPSGVGIISLYDSMDNVTRIEAWYNGQLQKVLADSIKYLPFGRQKKWKLGNGIWVSNIYDQRYLVDSIWTGADNIMKWDYSINKVGNITQITDNLDTMQTRRFEYDDIYRLKEATCEDYPGNYSLKYWYKKNGNRDSVIAGAMVPQLLIYKYNNNRLDSILLDEFSPVVYQYDALGNVTSKTGNWTYIYNGASRLTEYDRQGLSSYFSYDARNRRVKEVSEAGPGVKYVNNSAGQILSEFDLNGYRLADYVYLNGVLLSKLGFVLDPACADTGGGPITGPQMEAPGGGGGGCDSIPVAYYYHTDHLGTPWYLTSQGKSVVWKGEYLPFGELYAETVSQTSYHRLPGQYKEDNTLYYNWHRWYDPTLGRYLQPDPIGLGGDLNIYVYGQNSPINEFDPSGLKPLSLEEVSKLVLLNNQSDQSNALIICLIWKESSFDPLARPKDTLRSSARGLMQITRTALRDMRVKIPLANSRYKYVQKYNYEDLFDPAVNVMAGTEYLGLRISRAKGNLVRGLEGYGTGLGYADNILKCVQCFRESPCKPTTCLQIIHK